MNQFSLSFTTKVVIFLVAIVAVLFSALLLSGVLELKNAWIRTLYDSGPMSLLERKVTIPDSFSEEARSLTLQHIETTRALIRSNPKNAEAWLDLAILYKTANDIDGAVKIWEYLIETTTNPTAVQNLANTYHLDLKEYEKSEEYYRKILELEPKNVSAYIGFHELYRYSYKQDTNAAVDILRNGLEKVGEQEKINIFLALGSYYRETNDRESAISAYQDARDIARESGNTTLVRQINTELSALSR